MDKETREYFDGKVEELKRYVGVMIESFQSKLDLIVEGHQGLSEKLEVEKHH